MKKKHKVCLGIHYFLNNTVNGLYLACYELSYLPRHFMRILIMTKLTLFLITVLAFSATAGSYAQNLTLKVSGVTMPVLFKQIYEKTGYSFVFDEGVIKDSKPIHLNVKDCPINEVLDELLKNTDLYYQIKHKTIVLVRHQHKIQIKTPMDIQDIQEERISGIVTDEQGQALPGVSVRLKEAGRIVSVSATDAKGKYVIGKRTGADILSFSYVGYESYEMPIKDRNRIDLRMKLLAGKLEDVVVTGIFERPKESFTGSAKTISIEELKQVNSMSVLSAVAALDPSFVLVPNNSLGSDINNLPDIKLRGENSLPNLSGELAASPNLPLFILDGFETTSGGFGYEFN